MKLYLKTKNVLDERETQEMYRIEHRGLWGMYALLCAAVVAQMFFGAGFAGGFRDIRSLHICALRIGGCCYICCLGCRFTRCALACRFGWFRRIWHSRRLLGDGVFVVDHDERLAKYAKNKCEKLRRAVVWCRI